MDSNNGISAVIIAFNEAENIGRCIESVKDLVNEVLVVDSYSTDNTVKIASSLGAKVIQHPFSGHIQQKNWAKDQARFDWVLSLDADECLSIPLRKNLKAAIDQGLVFGKTKGYNFSRLNHLGNLPIRGCGWYPDTKLRLWDRRCGTWAGRNPHDKFELNVSDSIRTISGDILHYTYSDLEAVKIQAIKFGKIGGLALRDFWNMNPPETSQGFSQFQQQRRGLYFVFLVKLITAGPVRFFRNYLLKGGWKYGKNGLMICYWQGVEATLKYRWALFGRDSASNSNHVNQVSNQNH